MLLAALDRRSFIVFTSVCVRRFLFILDAVDTPHLWNSLQHGPVRSTGVLFQLADSVCKGVDKIVPVDVYVPGCPVLEKEVVDRLAADLS